MGFTLTDGNDDLIGIYGSVEAAKQGAPLASEWRQDEHRPMGWNGWLPDAVSFSVPDYKITFVGNSQGRMVQLDPTKGKVQTREGAPGRG